MLENIPFWIEINFTIYCSFYEQELLVPCTFSKCKHKFDLTQYFKDIKLETKDGSFIPDLLLISEKEDKIFIEIAVTHKSTLEKMQSKQRILELNIRSELDINTIKKCVLKENKNIYFFNFKRQEKKNFCQGECIRGCLKSIV
ncbi:hypothetical protein H6G06_00055 [Anabaena sphaerica FACHB-251]|uniref:Uncharacterized protein n=1 Tax=Anabaena sphaerica FACHB-251 TaxID=2692883 RepID=A0A926ZZ17_9NOST|nr:hypothetical protein [Anabaena sphaerica]MBD2291908.1 hypothetical protein [Anabaena sphaerica FACHB-251]